MRFVLRSGTREVVLFSRDRFVHFEALEPTAELFANYLLTDKRNQRVLREALATDPDNEHLIARDDVGLVVRVAQMVTTGALACVPNIDSLVPWDWRMPETPTFPGDPLDAEGDGENPLMEDDEGEEDEDERTDEKPEPVIPPEYPRLAKNEAEALDMQTKFFNFDLDLLRFAGAKAVGLSEVAKEVVKVALGGKISLFDSAKGTATVLIPMGLAGKFLVVKSQLGPQFASIADLAAVSIKGKAGLLGDVVGVLAKPGTKGNKVSELCKVFVDLAKHQGAIILDKAGKVVGSKLKDVLGKVLPVGATEIGPIFKQVTSQQTEKLVYLVKDTAKTLLQPVNSLIQIGATVVGPAFKEMAVEQGGKLQTAASNVGITLKQLLGTPEKTPQIGLGAGGMAPVKPLSEQDYEKGNAKVAFRALDEKTQKPIAGVVVKIKTSKGDIVEVQTDASGAIQLKDLPAGKFDILSVQDKRGYEVVELRSSL